MTFDVDIALLLALAFLSGMGLGYGLYYVLLWRFSWDMLPERSKSEIVSKYVEYLIQSPEGRAEYIQLILLRELAVAEQKRHEGVN